MKWIKEHSRTCKLIVFLLVLIAGWIFLFKCTGVGETTEVRYNKPLELPKVIQVKKPYVKPKVVPNVPVKKKKVYTIKDTNLRKEAEKKDIILDIKIVDNKIISTVIDSSGQVSENILDIPIQLREHKELVIVPEGVQVKEKTKAGKFLQKVAKNGKRVLIVVGGIAIILVIGAVAGG